MPSSSKKQHNLMAAVAHNPQFAKKVGIPQSVGKDFSNADKGKKFSKGGDMKKMSKGGDTSMSNSSKEKKGMTKETMGKVRTGAPNRDGIAARGRTKGTIIKMSGNTVGTGSSKK